MSTWMIYAGVGVILLSVLVGILGGAVISRFIAPEIRLIKSNALRREIRREARKLLQKEPLCAIAAVLFVCAFGLVPRKWFSGNWTGFARCLIFGVPGLMCLRYSWRKAVRHVMRTSMLDKSACDL